MTLFAYVSREHPSGERAWSAAGYKQWTQDVPSPDTPGLMLFADDDTQRMVVSVRVDTTTGFDNTTAQIEVQRLIDDGTYRAVRNLTNLPVIVDESVDYYDYEAARFDAENTYRVRCSMWHTVDAVRRYSAWTESAEYGPAYNVTGWNLKAVDDPTANFVNASVLAAPSVDSQMPSGVLEPMDRERPVVMVGTIAGFSGALEVSCLTATDIAALEALAAYRGTVYLEDAFGGAKHVAITKVAWTYRGTRTAPARRAVVEYTEVDSGLAVSTTA
jgi:hypothetical protein